jgi:hypothetical protein
MYTLYSRLLAGSLFSLGMVTISMSIPTSAHAQMANNPWSFKPQNRASVAALIRQVETQDDAADAVTQIAAPASFTNLVCGSDGKSAATGNSTCVILNNATGGVNVGQDADGNQTASTNNADATIETFEGND